MRKKIDRKGFTLAELLIVVAIIGVLVAISIPIFTSQLNKARVATDEANIRAGYAEVVAEILDDSNSGSTWTLYDDGITSSGSEYKTKGSTSSSVVIGGNSVSWGVGASVKYNYNSSSDTVTISIS